MIPGILGKKIGMTQVFRADGQVVPVTVLKAGPCVVVQRKTPTVDGYDAAQLGLVEFVKAKSLTKPVAGHVKKANADGVKFMRELPLNGNDLKTGDRVLVDQFKPKDKVDVIGLSKGRGFASLVKRHHVELANYADALDGLVLQNHGTLTVGRTVAEAFMLMHLLERAAEAQLRAMAAAVSWGL